LSIGEQGSLPVKEAFFKFPFIITAVRIGIGPCAVKYAVFKWAFILGPIGKDNGALSGYHAMVKLSFEDTAVRIGHGAVALGAAVFKHAFIDVAVRIILVALAGKFSVGELTGILAAFREDIFSIAVDTVALNALPKGQGRREEQH
jgi:hypothetical protein